MRIFIISMTAALLIMFPPVSRSEVSVKLKDISFIDGLKPNQVYGFGLVVGLQGTGDSRSMITRSSLKNTLKSLGLEGDDANSKNTAAVLLTAQLPPFVRIGDRIDITVSSIGDAKSLEGGILIQSTLKGGDNITYAVVQGPLAIQGGDGKVRGVKTVAVVTGGGVIEKEIIPDIVKNNAIFLVLSNWDYSAADSIIKSLEKQFPESKPESGDGKIKINLPKDVKLHEFISAIQNIEITPAYNARVVVNERTGTIVTGGNVKISEAIVSKEGVTVEIAKSDKRGSVAHLKESGTVKDLMDVLNLIGLSTRDIISILKALKDAGALHAELIIK